MASVLVNDVIGVPSWYDRRPVGCCYARNLALRRVDPVEALNTCIFSRSGMCFTRVWNKGAFLSRLPTKPTFHVRPNAVAI
jgi:hypothetical protein